MAAIRQRLRGHSDLGSNPGVTYLSEPVPLLKTAATGITFIGCEP